MKVCFYKREATPIQQFEQSREELKAMGQHIVSEMEAVRTEMGEDDSKVQRILEKFKSSKLPPMKKYVKEAQSN